MYSGLTTEQVLVDAVQHGAVADRVDAALELAWRLRIREVERSRRLVQDARGRPGAEGRVAVFDLRETPPSDADEVLALSQRADLSALWALRAVVVGADRLIDGLAVDELSRLTAAAEQARTQATGLVGPGDLQAVENMLGRVAMVNPERQTEAVEHYERAAELSALAGEHAAQAVNLVNAASTLNTLNDPSGALERYLHALEVSAEDAQPRVLSFVHGNVAILYWGQGSLAEATHHADRAVEVSRRCAGVHLLLHCLGVRARIALSQHALASADSDIAELRRLAHQADDWMGHRPVVETLRACWLLLSDRPQEALETLDRAPPVKHPAGALERTQVRVRALSRLELHAEAIACAQPVADRLVRMLDPLHDGVIDDHVENLRAVGRLSDAIDFLQARNGFLRTEPQRLARLRMASLAREVELRAARAHADDARAHVGRLKAQLIRAQRLEAFGQLAAGLAHDFNNVLMVVMATADALEYLPAGPERASSLHALHRAVDQATSLTRRLLTVARRSDLTLVDVHLGRHLEGILPVLKTAAGRCDLRLAVDTDRVVLVDPNMLDQALLNLVINARDAMSERGGIVVSATDLGHLVRLSVSDTGPGIAESELTRIFDPFYSTKGEGGTGLGLAMVWGIAQQFGGDVAVDSEVGVGTTFTVELRAKTTSEGHVMRA